MPTLHARGIDFYYEEHGRAGDPPLLMAHGLLGSIAEAGRFGERAADIAALGVHVVCYDARGHGRSGYTTHRVDYSWTSLAEDMHEVLRGLDLDRPTIYGGSMGAGTALMLALVHPERVGRLILQSPPPLGSDIRAARRMLGALATLYQLVGTELAARIVTSLPSMRRLERQGAAGGMRTFLARQRRAAIVPAIRGVLANRLMAPERFAEIAHPTLILTHPDDVIHPLESGETLHRAMPHAKLAVAPSATYWQEHPDELSQLVAAFARCEEVAAVSLGVRHAG
ncbi:MAG: alpha/beta hydrolase [Dehalococcoidia bacterium]|nr:MAG: alpha/beta hydrolase [Dehalococcoidia bacterium]